MQKIKKFIKGDFSLCLLLYLVALLPRLLHLSGTTVYPDEITWMVKGKEFIYALGHLNLNYFSNAWWQNTHDAYAIGIPLVFVNGLSHVLFAGAGKFSLHLFSDIIASRLPGVFIGPLTIPLIYLFGRRFTGKSIGIIAALAYAGSPIAMGLDLWVIHDSFLTLFSFLGIYSFLVAGKTSKHSFLPGFWLALAFLTKPLGLLVVVPWLVLFLIKPNKQFYLSLIFRNFISFWVATLVLWPASWLSPLTAVPGYLFRQIFLVQSGDPIHNFYLGVQSDNPSWSYYGFQFFARTPEIVIIGLIIAVIIFSTRLFIKKTKNRESYFLPIFYYSLAFLLVITVSHLKGGVRYALPLLPWFYLASAWGFTEMIKERKILISAYLLLSIYPVLLYTSPYLYYNQFVGGPAAARKFDLVGLCFGNQAALSYMDSRGITGSVGVIGCSASAAYHTNRSVVLDLSKADYLIVETAFTQTYDHHGLLKNLIGKNEIQKIYEDGVQTAAIYR